MVCILSITGQFIFVLLFFFSLTLLFTGNLQTGTLSNSEDPDEMLLTTAFRQSSLFAKFREIGTPHHPMFIISDGRAHQNTKG